MFVPCILNGEYMIVYVVISYEAPLPQYLNWLAVSGFALREGNRECLAMWDTICVACNNGIVHSHQLCSLENAFTYIFKDFCRLISFAFGSDSNIQLLLAWLVKYLAGFGKFRSNCVSGKIRTFGSLSDIAATGNVILLL